MDKRDRIEEFLRLVSVIKTLKTVLGIINSEEIEEIRAELFDNFIHEDYRMARKHEPDIVKIYWDD